MAYTAEQTLRIRKVALAIEAEAYAASQDARLAHQSNLGDNVVRHAHGRAEGLRAAARIARREAGL